MCANKSDRSPLSRFPVEESSHLRLDSHTTQRRRGDRAWTGPSKPPRRPWRRSPRLPPRIPLLQVMLRRLFSHRYFDLRSSVGLRSSRIYVQVTLLVCVFLILSDRLVWWSNRDCILRLGFCACLCGLISDSLWLKMGTWNLGVDLSSQHVSMEWRI